MVLSSDIVVVFIVEFSFTVIGFLQILFQGFRLVLYSVCFKILPTQTTARILLRMANRNSKDSRGAIVHQVCSDLFVICQVCHALSNDRIDLRTKVSVLVTRVSNG